MARLTQLRTLLTANDLSETIAFYERLGFECIGTWVPPGHDDGKPVWCQVARDDVKLMFNQGDSEPHDDGDGVMHVHEPGMEGYIYLDVDDVDALFADVKSVVHEFEHELADQPHGMREFALRDPNGYQLIFGAPTS